MEGRLIVTPEGRGAGERMIGGMEFPTTARLRIRELRPDDAEHLVALHGEAEVMRYITDGRPDDPERIRHEVLPRWLGVNQKLDGWGFLVAEVIDSGEFVGWFHLLPTQTEGEWDLGYRLHRRFWGRGLATEGARALLQKMAWTNSATRVIARCMAANGASARVMEKLGLTYAADYQEAKFPGQDKRALIYATDWSTIIHRRVWAARQGVNPTVIRKLESGWVVFGDSQSLRGYTLLLADPICADLNRASADVRAAFTRDMALVGDALLRATGARLINYMILENTDYALHAHIFPRYVDEAPEKRRTGPWVYLAENCPMDLARDGALMARIGEELDAVR